MPSVDYDYGPQGSRTLPNTANAFKDEDEAAAALAGGGEPPHPLLPESFGSHAPARPRQRSTTLASEPRTDSDEPPEHLPKIEAGSTSPTAYPNWHVLADREVELAGLTDADRLDGVLADPASAASLREFAAHLPDPRATLLLSLYGDLLTFSNQATQLRLASSAISSSYFLANSPLRLSLNISQRGPVLAAVYRAATVGHGLTEPLQAIRREIAEQVLDVWVQESVTKQLSERLGLWQPGTGWTGRLIVEGAGPMARSDGLSESFCLTDPNSHDNTIVAASEGFSSVTGYPVAEIVGRNCRFLQGPGSSPTSVKKLRDALARGERITQTVFNCESLRGSFGFAVRASHSPLPSFPVRPPRRDALLQPRLPEPAPRCARQGLLDPWRTDRRHGHHAADPAGDELDWATASIQLLEHGAGSARQIAS